MSQAQAITPAERAQVAAHLLARAGEYGVVSTLSRTLGVARPTLYAWRDRAQQALLHAFTPVPQALEITPALEREVLTLWVAAHASPRGIQTVDSHNVVPRILRSKSYHLVSPYVGPSSSASPTHVWRTVKTYHGSSVPFKSDTRSRDLGRYDMTRLNRHE